MPDRVVAQVTCSKHRSPSKKKTGHPKAAGSFSPVIDDGRPDSSEKHRPRGDMRKADRRNAVGSAPLGRVPKHSVLRSLLRITHGNDRAPGGPRPIGSFPQTMGGCCCARKAEKTDRANAVGLAREVDRLNGRPSWLSYPTIRVCWTRVAGWNAEMATLRREPKQERRRSGFARSPPEGER